MNFNFKISNFIRNDITRIDNTLLPEGFAGDRRDMRGCMHGISDILNEMGIASAKAQGLLKPITSADKLRNSEHTVYLLIDKDGNKTHGSVIGMLKMGRKNLYMFDENGQCHEVYPLCVLDFYVHESKQRMGCGKKLFEYMLKVENVKPDQLAIDRPSEKFLLFLRKHYNLVNSVPQTNNFVVFWGFFNKSSQNNQSESRQKHYSIASPQHSPYSPGNSVTYNGRHTAHKPESTVGKIIHSSPLM